MDYEEAAIGEDLVRGLVGASIGGPSNNAFVVAAVPRDDRGKAAQIVPTRELRSGRIGLPALPNR